MIEALQAEQTALDMSNLFEHLSVAELDAAIKALDNQQVVKERSVIKASLRWKLCAWRQVQRHIENGAPAYLQSRKKLQALKMDETVMALASCRRALMVDESVNVADTGSAANKLAWSMAGELRKAQSIAEQAFAMLPNMSIDGMSESVGDLTL